MLLNLLYQGPEERRAESLRMLAEKQAADDWSVSRIADLLCDPSPTISRAAEAVLLGIGRRASPFLGAWFRDWRLRSVPILEPAGRFSPRQVAVEPLLSGISGTGRPTSALERARPVLEALGWQPATDEERVVLSIVRGEPMMAAGWGAVAAVPLIHFLSQCDERSIDALESALAAVGAAALPHLLQSLGDLHHRRRDCLLRVVETWGRAAAGGATLIALEELMNRAGETFVLRRAAALTLRNLGGAPTSGPANALWAIAVENESPPSMRLFEGLHLALKDSDSAVREAAMVKAARVDDVNVILLLIQGLSDPDWRVRGAALRAIVRFHEPHAITAVVRVLVDPYHASDAEAVLVEIGAAAVPVLEGAIRAASSSELAHAARALIHRIRAT